MLVQNHKTQGNIPASVYVLQLLQQLLQQPLPEPEKELQPLQLQQAL